MYFKIFKPISWGERPAERRSRFIQRFPRNFLSRQDLKGADVLCVPQAFQTDGSAENTRHPPQGAPSGFPKNREALAGLSRADGERFFGKARFGKCSCTLCTRKGHAASVRRQSRQRLRNTSNFSNRWIGEKYPAKAEAAIVRCCLRSSARPFRRSGG